MAQRLLLVVLCCFIFLKQADAYKVVQIENVEAKPEENSVEFKIQFSHASDLPRGFRMTDWDGMGGCNWIHPCDWIGIWKEDKRDSDQGCKETSEGWKCPYSTQYTSGHDLVKRAGYMSVDMYKELTPTTKDSRYHVYYCLTPQYIRKWTSYDCIARTEFLLPDPVAEKEEADALRRPVSSFAKISLLDDQFYEKDTDDAVLLNPELDTKIEALIELDAHVPTSQVDEGFAGVFKIRGEHSGRVCSVIPDDEKLKQKDKAVFLCDLSKMLTKMTDDGQIEATRNSRETVSLKWDRTPQMDSDSGYAVFLCMSNKFSLANILSRVLSWENRVRCFARTALFKVKEDAKGPTWSSSDERQRERKSPASDFHPSECIVPPPKQKWYHKGIAGVKAGFGHLATFGLNVPDRIMGVFTPRDNSINALKMRYFDRFKYVDTLYGMIMGYDTIRILNAQGKVRVSYKDKKLKISAFDRDHSAGNFNDEVKDCKHRHTSVVSLDLDLVNVKFMQISDPSKWVGAAKMRIKIDFALNLKATYLGGTESDVFNEEYFATLFEDVTDSDERPIEVGTHCQVRLRDGSDTPTEFVYEGEVTKIHHGNNNDLSYDLKFVNGAVRSKVPKEDVRRVPKSKWNVNPNDNKVCVTDVDIQFQSSGVTEWLRNPSALNSAVHAAVQTSSGIHTFLMKKLLLKHVHHFVNCGMSRNLDNVGQFGVLAKAAEYQHQVMMMVESCIQDSSHPYCAGVDHSTLEKRLERYKQNQHNLQFLLEFHLQDRGTPEEHLSISLRTDLDTSSSGLLRMALDPLIDAFAVKDSDPANPEEYFDALDEDPEELDASDEEGFFDPLSPSDDLEVLDRFKGLNKRNNNKKNIRRRHFRRHLLMEEDTELLEDEPLAEDGSNNDVVEVRPGEDPLFDLYERVKLDLTQFAELTARANKETSVMIKTLGNFLLRGEANLDFTIKGGALKLNPDLPSSSKICQEHMERHGPAGCDHLLVVESKEFTFALLVPHDHSISVPFRWAILDQPFGDWSLADRERWSEAFEYFGDMGMDLKNLALHGPMRSGLKLVKRSLAKQRGGDDVTVASMRTSSWEDETVLSSPRASTIGEISEAPSLTNMMLNDFLESGIDTLLDEGVSLSLIADDDKGIHIDKEFLNFHFTMNFKGPSNLENIARWVLEARARSRGSLEEWARLRLERIQNEGTDLPPEAGPGEVASRLIRTITGGDLLRHVSGGSDRETGSDVSDLSDREWEARSSVFPREEFTSSGSDGSPTVFLEVKKRSPCNKRVNMGSLDRIEFCKECVKDNPTDGTFLTWERKKMFKKVTTEYSGCYWDPDKRECRMNQRDTPVEDSDSAATTLEACETMYMEDDTVVEEEDDTVVEETEDTVVEEEEEETPLSNIAFDSQNHNAIRAVSLARNSRECAYKFIRRAAARGTGTKLGDDCVNHVNGRMLEEYNHDAEFVKSLSRAACIRAAALSIVLDNDGKISSLQKKLFVKNPLHHSDFPSGSLKKWEHPLKLGPKYGGEKDNDFLQQFIFDFENFEVEGLGPQCGYPSAVTGEGASLMRTQGSLKETCVQLWAGELKMWHGIGSFFSKRYAEIQLCASILSGRRLTIGISKEIDRAIFRDRFDKRYMFLNVPTIVMDLPDEVPEGVELKTPTIEVKLQELSVRKGTVKRRGFFFTSQKKPKTYKLQWNNLDDYTAVSTVIGYLGKLENAERDAPLDEDSAETSVDTLPRKLATIQEKIRNLIDETNRQVNEVLEDKWWTEKMPRKKYPLRWVSSWPIRIVGKVAVGAKSIYLSKADVQLRVDTTLALKDGGVPRIRIWIGSSHETADNFDDFVSLVDICDPELKNTKEAFADLGVVARNGKILLNSGAGKGIVSLVGDGNIHSLSLDFKAGIYAILEWDTTTRKWSMKNENVKFCVPRGGDDYLKIDVNMGRNFLEKRILKKFITGPTLRHSIIIDTVVPQLRSQLFCAIESRLLGVDDHLPVDTNEAQSHAEPTLVAILLAGLLEDIRSTPDDESKRFYMSLKIALSNVGTRKEKLSINLDQDLDLSTEALFTSLLEHDEELVKYLRRHDPNDVEVSPDGEDSEFDSENIRVAAIARYVGRWAERLDSSNTDFLPRLVGMLAKLFYVRQSNLAIQMDASMSLDMHENETLLDTLYLSSKQMELTGKADNIPVPLGSLMGLPELLTESIGMVDHEIDYDDFRFSLDKMDLGFKPFFLKGPAMGTILDAIHAMCVQGQEEETVVRITNDTELDAILELNGAAEEEEEEESEEEEEKLSVSMSCEFLRVLQHYLNDNDVKLEIKARDDKDTPGSGFFMDRERFKTSLKGIFQGPVDISAVTNFVTNAYLVNNGEMGGDVSDDESSSSSSGVSQTMADKFARGMRDAVRYIEQEMAARNRRQRTMFGLIRDIA